MSGEASQAEVEEYFAFLDAHPDFEPVVSTLQSFWAQTPDSLETGTLWQKVVVGLQTHPEWHTIPEAAPQQSIEYSTTQKGWLYRHKYVWLGAAASVLVLLAFALNGYRNAGAVPPALDADANAVRHQVKTQSGSRTSLTLPDGSTVWLNANSKISYADDFGTTNRNIWLNGEGMFKVSKNKALPFTIHTRSMKVRATGTLFNVRAYENDANFETSLLEGQVVVTISGKGQSEYTLKPNQKLLVSNMRLSSADAPASPTNQPKAFRVALQKISFQPGDSTVLETAWAHNKLMFADETFESVASKMEHWFGVEFQFAHNTLAQEHLSGSFENETLEQALLALQYTTPFHYRITGNQVFITP